MSRLAAVCSVLALGGLVVLGRADSKPAKPAEPFKPPPIAAKPILTPLPVRGAAPTPARTESVAARLMQPVKFPGFDDPALTLGEALEMLSKNCGVDIEVNEQAFTAEGQNDVLKATVFEKKIPKRDKIRLDRLLRTVLGKINVPSGATFLLRGNSIEVTTNQVLRLQIWGKYNGPLLPLVNTTFEKKPLEEALKELADRAEYNVVLDNRVGDKAKLPVTARFANTPLDTATAFLADMTDLRPVLLDNVVYVTTRENAAVWEARLKKAIAPEGPVDEAASGPRIGFGVGNLPPLPPAAGGGM